MNCVTLVEFIFLLLQMFQQSKFLYVKSESIKWNAERNAQLNDNNSQLSLLVFLCDWSRILQSFVSELACSIPHCLHMMMMTSSFAHRRSHILSISIHSFPIFTVVVVHYSHIFLHVYNPQSNEHFIFSQIIVTTIRRIEIDYVYRWENVPHSKYCIIINEISAFNSFELPIQFVDDRETRRAFWNLEKGKSHKKLF